MHEWLPVIVVVMTVGLGVLYNNSKLSDFSKAVSKEFELSRELFRSELRRVEENLKSDLTRVEENLKSELKRVEQKVDPVKR